MDKAKRIGFIVAVIVGGFFAGDAFMKWLQQRTPAAQEAKAVVSQTRPAFAFPDLQGVKRSVAEWDGKVLVINFWATWCPPCRRETPMFVELQQQLGARGLQFVGVALDEQVKVADFAEQMEVSYPILLAGDDSGVDIATAYGNRFGTLPYTVVVNRAGNIVQAFRGEVKKDELLAVVNPLL